MNNHKLSGVKQRKLNWNTIVGLHDKDGLTFEEIGKLANRSKQCIQGIYRRAKEQQHGND